MSMAYAKHITAVRGYIAGQVEVTSRCFHRCPKCVSWREGEPAEWDLDDFWKLYDQLTDMDSFEHLTLTGGDPQAWKVLPRVLEHHRPGAFDLQLTTAVMPDLPVTVMDLYRNKVKTILFSLDAATPETMEQSRGVKTDPAETARYLQLLAHPDLRIRCTLDEYNIGEVRRMVALAEQTNPARISFAPVYNLPLSDRFRALYEEYSVMYPVFSWMDLDWRMAGYSNTRCWASRVSFHIKPNGDLYPCCIIGGESLGTRQEFRLGNVKDTPLSMLWGRSVAFSREHAPYHEGSVCREVCLPKQAGINRAAETVCETRLSIP